MRELVRLDAANGVAIDTAERASVQSWTNEIKSRRRASDRARKKLMFVSFQVDQGLLAGVGRCLSLHYSEADITNLVRLRCRRLAKIGIHIQ